MDEQGETEEQQLRRNVNELLQELRVAQSGVQILFGFLLAVTFTEPYERATAFQHVVHLVTVGFAALAIALLIAPAAWHRVLFRQGQRRLLVDQGNVMAIVGLAALAMAMTGTVLLIADVATDNVFAITLAVVATLGFGVLWFVLPLRHRRD